MMKALLVAALLNDGCRRCCHACSLV